MRKSEEEVKIDITMVESEFSLSLVRPEMWSIQLLWCFAWFHPTRLKNEVINCIWYSERKERQGQNACYHGLNQFFQSSERPEMQSTRLLCDFLQSQPTRLKNKLINCTWYREKKERWGWNTYYHGPRWIFFVASEARNMIDAISMAFFQSHLTRLENELINCT